MTLTIWGAGAIGGTIGAYLARAGHDVSLVDADPAHVAAIQDRGMCIEGPLESFVQPLRALLPAEVDPPLETVLLCVKAHATDTALDDLLPRLAPDGTIVSVQNGLNELRIAERAGAARTIGAFVNFGADVLKPGAIHFAGRGAFVLGELDGRDSDRVRALADTLRAFDPDLLVSDNVWGYLWGKMGYGAMLFASALTDDSIADVLDAREARPILTALAGEVLAVAAAEGIAPMGFNGFDPVAFASGGTDAQRDASFDAMVVHNRRSAKSHSGVWRDLAVHKRPTEAAAQFGPVLDAAARHGVPAPVTTTMVQAVHAVEQGRAPQAWSTLAALQAALPARGAPA